MSLPVVLLPSLGRGASDFDRLARDIRAAGFETLALDAKLLRAVEQALQREAPKPAPLPGHGPIIRPGSLPLRGGLTDLTVETAMTAGQVVMSSLPPLPTGPQSEQSFALDRPLREARDAFEKAYFEFHLAKEGGSMTRVAEKTGLERTHLYRKLKQLGVDFSRGKRSTG